MKVDYDFVMKCVVIVCGMILVIEGLDIFFGMQVSPTLVIVFSLVFSFGVGLFVSDRYLFKDCRE